MDYRDKINDMLMLQNRLNTATNGEHWQSGMTDEGKLISWRRCIYMEAAELIDSFAWKHWKNINAAPDLDNIAIEIADIWHFIMSLGLEQCAGRFSCSLDTLADDIAVSFGFNAFCKEAYNPANYDKYEILADIEHLIHLTTSPSVDFWQILRPFFAVSLKCGVNLDRLYALYMGKNVLNQFRQDHGYKSGEYLKSWDGVEDNAVLSAVLQSGVVGYDEIYGALKAKYPVKNAISDSAKSGAAAFGAAKNGEKSDKEAK